MGDMPHISLDKNTSIEAKNRIAELEQQVLYWRDLAVSINQNKIGLLHHWSKENAVDILTMDDDQLASITVDELKKLLNNRPVSVGSTWIIKDREGRSPIEGMRKTFEYVVSKNTALNNTLKLEPNMVNGVFSGYTCLETNLCWVGYALGIRFIEKLRDSQRKKELTSFEADLGS